MNCGDFTFGKEWSNNSDGFLIPYIVRIWVGGWVRSNRLVRIVLLVMIWAWGRGSPGVRI